MAETEKETMTKQMKLEKSINSLYYHRRTKTSDQSPKNYKLETEFMKNT